MKSRENLVRLKRFQVNEKSRQLAQLDMMIAEFERMAGELEVQIAAEEKKAIAAKKAEAKAREAAAKEEATQAERLWVEQLKAEQMRREELGAETPLVQPARPERYVPN